MAESRIIHGFHAVTARIRQNADSVLEVYVDAQRKDPRARDLLKLAESNGVRVIRWTASVSTAWPEVRAIRALPHGWMRRRKCSIWTMCWIR